MLGAETVVREARSLFPALIERSPSDGVATISRAMADTAPVVFESPSGSFEIPRRSVEWLWEILDDHELPGTRAALDQGLDGGNVTLPDAERPQLVQALQALEQRAPAQAQAIADLLSHLAA